MNRVPWLCFQVLVSRLGPLDTQEFVLWHVHTILIHELVRSARQLREIFEASLQYEQKSSSSMRFGDEPP